ncbi:juvenile hormone acid O-methyltransferase-like [Harmonia axyridis]|uniref:juvenile hormone acid O-methyltransferase-like n=1 Tax=Harmonia axyridis TaxID=115357 RepID=UPI001E275430|nr:juvenile hormone acid O-methyltransferase-like [Harmonia axyridis]
MFKAVKHFNHVTFQFPIVKKMYANHLRRIKWPNHPLRIMDIGCGTGRVLLEILEPQLPRHYSEIVGVDFNQNMIDVCNKLERDSRITFEVMDIETKAIPKKFSNSFDLVTSCFALHYVRDLRRALVNCNNLLKVKSELVLIFSYVGNPLYEVYKTMSSIEEWNPYTKGFQNYVPLFSPTNPLQELKLIFNECGLDVLESELNHDPYESVSENFLALFASVDFIYPTIPTNKKQEYEKDFTKIFANIAGLSFEEKDLKKKAHMYFPAITVRGRKLR